MKYIINNRNFITLTISIALVVLMITMFFVYWNYPVSDKTIPHAMTTCPDYWAVTPKGKCVIPSADIPNANIGKLDKYKMPLYQYVIRNSDGSIKEIKNTVSIYDTTDKNGNTTTYEGTQYKDPDGNGVYYYDISGLLPASAYDSTNYTYPITIDFMTNDVIKDWQKFNGIGSRICQVQRWVNSNKIQWDGLNKYNHCGIFTQKLPSNMEIKPTKSAEDIADIKKDITYNEYGESKPLIASNMYGEKSDIFIDQ